MLFTDLSILTMLHGIVLGGSALMALAAALFFLYVWRTNEDARLATLAQTRAIARLVLFAAGALWLTVIAGTYVIFPPYRASPPEGTTDLSRYPRSLIQSNPETSWLHSFAMEMKEHVPWIVVMLATAAAFVVVRYRSTLFSNAQLKGMTLKVLAICLVLTTAAAILGVFVNKVAPLY